MTSLWLRDAAPGPCTPLPATADAVVIGGGIAGVSLALHLAERGVRVALVEREAIGARATGRNDGQLLLGLGEPYHRVHGQFGAARARLLWQFLADNQAALHTAVATHGIACDLAPAGGLRLAETPHEWSELQATAALLAEDRLDHALVPATDLPRWLPAATGYHGGLFLPGEAVVQPVQLVRGLAAAAVAQGAAITAPAAATAIDGEAGDFTVRLADGRTVAAPVVVHCTAALARSLDPSGMLARTVFPFRGQIVATDPLPADVAAGFPGHAMSSNFGYEYFRVHGGRFVIGGMRWSVRGEELGVLDDSTTHAEVTRNLLAYVARHFPDLAAVPFPHAWTGIMAGTPDGLPLCGALPGAPGTYALGAFNGYGLSFAFLAGRCLAELIVAGRSTHPAMPLFAPRRFQLA